MYKRKRLIEAGLRKSSPSSLVGMDDGVKVETGRRFSVAFQAQRLDAFHFQLKTCRSPAPYSKREKERERERKREKERERGRGRADFQPDSSVSGRFETVETRKLIYIVLMSIS